MLSGDTTIGCHGRKYLVSLKGEKNATPRPPLVMASKTSCKKPLAKNTQKQRHFLFMDFSEMNNKAIRPSNAAKIML